MHLTKKQTPAEKRAATRERILHVATHLFSTLGFNDTTTRLICRRARVAKGALYLHFRNKEDLYRTVFRRRELHYTTGVRFIFRHGQKGPDRARQLASWTCTRPFLAGLCHTDVRTLQGTEFNRLAVRLIARLRWWAPNVDGIGFVQTLKRALVANAVANDTPRHLLPASA